MKYALPTAVGGLSEKNLDARAAASRLIASLADVMGGDFEQYLASLPFTA